MIINYVQAGVIQLKDKRPYFSEEVLVKERDELRRILTQSILDPGQDSEFICCLNELNSCLLSIAL
jgi:hypothetical protein